MKKFIASLIALAPSVAFAQQITDVNSLTFKLTNLSNTFLQILIGFAVIFIVWQVIRYIVKAEDPEARKTIGRGIIFGIVGLAIILSIWGLVRILTNTFKTDTTAPTSQYPQNPYPNPVP